MLRTLLLASWLVAAPVWAADLVIVVDDLGYNEHRAERVLALPAPVTVALLPFAPDTPAIARRARETGHEMILHQPMEALPVSHARLAVGTLTVDMPGERFDAELEAALNALPDAVGVNNHTGSRLTQDAPAMGRLMRHLAARHLLFLDSRTTPATVAYRAALNADVPAVQRDVFLDHVVRPQAIEHQFHRALTIARHQGYAVIIAHPHDASLDFLARVLPALSDEFSLTTLTRLAARPRPATLARHENPASPHRSLGQ